MTTEEQQQLEKYFGEVKKSLKNYSKNQLIRTIGALLLDKKIMNEEINRLNGQMGNLHENVTATDSNASTTNG